MRMLFSGTQRLMLLLITLVLFLMPSVTTGVAGQVASPTGGDDRAMPVFIHRGTCASIGEGRTELTPIGFPENGQVVGEPAIPAYQSVTELQGTSIDDLVNGSWIVTVARSRTNPTDIVACGQIGGTLFNRTLLFGLAPLQDPTFAGAVLIGTTQGGIQVVVYLITNPRGDVTGTPAATAPRQHGVRQPDAGVDAHAGR